MTPTVADLLVGRDNNFNLIRFLAASAVIYSHSFTTIQGDGGYWLATGIQTEDIGSLAVNVFFVLSGLLITKSWIEQPDLIRFALARVLRIFPALTMLSLVTVFVIGPIASSCLPGDYFTDLNTWLYVPLTTTLIDDSARLPGVFESVIQNSLVNAPLWTLKYEVLAYALIALLGGVALLKTQTRRYFVLVGISCSYIFIHFFTDWREQYAIVDNFVRMWSCFFIGAGFYILRARIRMRLIAAAVLAAAALTAHGTPLFDLTSKVFLAYAVTWLALVPAGLLRMFNQAGDYSYGLYIFAWPIQQIAVQAIPELTPHAHFVLVFPLSLLIAIMSWRYLERPCIRHYTTVRRMIDNSSMWVRKFGRAGFAAYSD